MTINEQFELASKELPIHNNRTTEDLFYKGFKFSRNKESGLITIYKIYTKSYQEVTEDKEIYEWLKKLGFKYVCDMMCAKRNFNRLYVMNRRFVKNIDSKDFNMVKGDVLGKITKSLELLLKYNNI